MEYNVIFKKNSPHIKEVTSICLDDKNDYLFAAAMDKCIRIIDLNSLHVINKIFLHYEYIEKLIFNDNKLIAAGSDKTISIWKISYSNDSIYKSNNFNFEDSSVFEIMNNKDKTTFIANNKSSNLHILEDEYISNTDKSSKYERKSISSDENKDRTITISNNLEHYYNKSYSDMLINNENNVNDCYDWR